MINKMTDFEWFIFFITAGTFTIFTGIALFIGNSIDKYFFYGNVIGSIFGGLVAWILAIRVLLKAKSSPSRTKEKLK